MAETTTEPAQAKGQGGRRARHLVLGATGVALALGLGGWALSRNGKQDSTSASAVLSAQTAAGAKAAISAKVAASVQAAGLLSAREGAHQAPANQSPPQLPNLNDLRERGLKPPAEKPEGEAKAQSGSMVRIEGGNFMMGSNDGKPDEKPPHPVTVATFWMDVTEVTVSAYKECVGSGGCSTKGFDSFCNLGKSDRGNHPINCVEWTQADSFCKWANKRLPTEEEWEFAARPEGSKIGKYPWGDTNPQDQLCWRVGGYTARITCEVGSYQPFQGASVG